MFVNEGRSKPKRGKRVALRVPINDSYHSLLRKAIEKWSAYHNNCYSESEEYVLVFDNGSEASTMPGIIIIIIIYLKLVYKPSLTLIKTK